MAVDLRDGAELGIDEVLRRYEHCRQPVLITEAEDPRTDAFYRSVGLVPGEEGRTTVFLRIP